MQELPHPWAEYARLQAIAAKSSTIDSRAWGLEAAMNALLEKPETYAASDARRDGDTAARRERSHQHIRRKHSWELEPPSIDLAAQVEAREALAVIRARVKPQQWALLVAMANDDKPIELAAAYGISKGAWRTQLCRLRHELAELRPAA